MVSSVTTPLLLVWAVLPDDALVLSSSVLPLLKTMIGFQLVPLALGLLLRHRWSNLAERLAPLLTRLSNGLLVAVVIGLLVLKGGVLIALDAKSALAMLTVVVTSLWVGGVAGSGSTALVRASALCTGVRNLAMALLLSASHFPDAETDGAILSFGLIMLVLPAALAAHWKRDMAGRVP
jgi:BASS family bile acid:Na+ symporter